MGLRSGILVVGESIADWVLVAKSLRLKFGCSNDREEENYEFREIEFSSSREAGGDQEKEREIVHAR